MLIISVEGTARQCVCKKEHVKLTLETQVGWQVQLLQEQDKNSRYPLREPAICSHRYYNILLMRNKNFYTKQTSDDFGVETVYFSCLNQYGPPTLKLQISQALRNPRLYSVTPKLRRSRGVHFILWFDCQHDPNGALVLKANRISL